VETYIHTIREELYYSGYTVEDKWRPSGWYMETDIHIIYTIYTYPNFELNRFIGNNEKLTLETRNSFYIYRRIIIHYKDAKQKKTPTHISEGWCFLL
jgi:hypothetical protein